MLKKISVLAFFWSTFIAFFYMIFNKSYESKSVNYSSIYSLDQIITLLGLFTASFIMIGYMQMSYEYLTKKN